MRKNEFSISNGVVSERLNLDSKINFTNHEGRLNLGRFIEFINNLIDYLKMYCIKEPTICIMHCLFHSHNTTIISTNILDRQTVIHYDVQILWKKY